MNKRQYIRLFFFLILLLNLFPNSLMAQFPPSAGQDGSTAISADNENLIAWGTTCTVLRGWKDIAQPDSGYVDAGQTDFVLGPPNNMTLSLGDRGEAIVTFEEPIRNGEGWDFAVFENGFDDTFLELAFVEVSSNGQDFYRFPATSLTDTTAEIGTFGLLNATKLNNLAGKYRVNQGTPFDLEELADRPNLDLEQITHIKLIDVVGSMNNTYASRDMHGNKINDPYPTPFPQGGFDLDAIGLRYQTVVNATNTIHLYEKIVLYPNPVPLGTILQIEGLDDVIQQDIELELYESNGTFVKKIEKYVIETANLELGLYFLKIRDNKQTNTLKIIVW